MKQVPLPALPFILLVGTIYGSNMVVARFSLGQYAPLTLVSLRMLIAGLIYLIFYTIRRDRCLPKDRGLWAKAGLSGILSTAIPLSGFIAAMQYISSGMTGLLDTLVPVWVTLLAHFLVSEKMTYGRALGTLIAFAGTGMLYMHGESGVAEFGRADWRGYAFAGIAILSSAIGIIYGRRYLRDYDVVDVSAMRMIVAAIVMLPAAWLINGFDLSKVTIVGVGTLFYLATVGTFVAFLLDFYILKRFGAVPASQSIYIIPVAAITFGALILREQVSLTMLLGMAIIFVGLILVNRSSA